MKKKAFKEILKYVRVIVFFAVITILVEAVNYVMVQPGYARYIIHTVDNPDDGSDYDCIVVELDMEGLQLTRIIFWKWNMQLIQLICVFRAPRLLIIII
ncbi:MAG: hypothetical protein ACLR7D_08665 [Lachnospira eligens]